MYIKKYFILLCIITLSGGCATLSEIKTANELLGGSSEKNENYVTVPTWWESYNDSQLNKLMQVALERNAEFATAAIRIRKAFYEAKQEASGLLPDLSTTGSWDINRDISQSEHSVRTYTGDIAISYEVDIWRKVIDAKTASEFEYKATVEDYNTVRLAITNNVIDIYFYLCYLNSAIAIIEERISIYEKLVADKYEKHHAGKISIIEFQKPQQSLLIEKEQLIAFQLEQKETLQSLLELLNMTTDELEWIELPDILSFKPLDIDLNIPLSFLAFRPDVKAAEYRLKKSFHDVQAAEKELYPSVTITSSISLSSNKFENSLDFPIAFANIKISLPFLNWHKLKWNIKITETEYKIHKVEFESKIRLALNEISTAYFNYKKAFESYSLAKEKIKIDTGIEEYYNVRYSMGANEITDWLDAAAELNNTKLALLKNYYLILKHEAQIIKTLAGRYVKK